MKKFSLLFFSLLVLATAGCSRSDKNETTVQPQSTPDAERLKSDSERLQQATNKAAEQRRREQPTSQASATPKPKGDASLLTVPPSPANPTP